MSIEKIARDIRQILAEFDADAADELLSENERADLWTDIDVPVEGLRALLDELSRLRAATKCPIGLDHVKEICSAGSCLTCVTGRYEHYYDRAKAYEATLKDIAASDDIENALDPARNRRVAARALSEREGQE